jgi:hypothetical protein
MEEYHSKFFYHFSHEYNPWWFQDTTLFQNVSELAKTLGVIKEK